MNKKLKPCPFCGNEYPSLIDALGEFWVLCDCKARGCMAVEEEKAISAWNTRAKPAWNEAGSAPGTRICLSGHASILSRDGRSAKRRPSADAEASE